MREISSILAIDPSGFCISPGTPRGPSGYGRHARRSCSQATLSTTVPSSTICTTRIWPITFIRCCDCVNCLHGSFMRVTSRVSAASVSSHSPMPIWQMQRGRGMRRTPGLWPVGNLTGPSSASNRVIPRRMCPPKISLRGACDDRERARKHTARWLWMQSSANSSLLAGFPANREKYREQLYVAGAHPGPMR